MRILYELNNYFWVNHIWQEFEIGNHLWQESELLNPESAIWYILILIM
jgi:hypothetical protein